MKKVKRVDLSKLTDEQRDAFIQFAKDCAEAGPAMQDMHNVARTIHGHMIRAKEWSIATGVAPEGARPNGETWNIGAPKVNYVDHIEGF